MLHPRQAQITSYTVQQQQTSHENFDAEDEFLVGFRVSKNVYLMTYFNAPISSIVSGLWSEITGHNLLQTVSLESVCMCQK